MILRWIKKFLNWLCGQRKPRTEAAVTDSNPALPTTDNESDQRDKSSCKESTTSDVTSGTPLQDSTPCGDQVQSHVGVPTPEHIDSGNVESVNLAEVDPRSGSQSSGGQSNAVPTDTTRRRLSGRASEVGGHPQDPSVPDCADPGSVESANFTETERLSLLPSSDGQSDPPQTELLEEPSGSFTETVDHADHSTDPEVVPARPDTVNPPRKKPLELNSLSTPLIASDLKTRPNTSKDRQDDRPRLPTKPPINAPGRRGKQSARGALSPRSPRTPRPELICRRNSASSTWQVVAAAEDGLASVRQHDHDLTIERGECLLDSFTGTLSISHGNAQSTNLEILGERSTAIFKFAANWNGDGRKVERITSGYYIVIASESEGFKQTGHMPHESEPCDDDSFLAFFFHRETSDETVDSIGFTGYALPIGTRRYQLEGKLLFDCSEQGPLFVGAVPKLAGLSDIPWARVGEEREGGWRGENFRPDETMFEHVIKGRQGRFFLRVYDPTKLVDSGEFRYVRDLREIRMNGEPFTSSQVLLPGPDGHLSTTVSFISRGGMEFRPQLAPVSAHAAVRGNTIVVEPHAGGDRITCFLRAGDASVEIVVDLPRVWWRLDSAGDSGKWQATSLTVTRDRFRWLARSDASVCLRLPKRITSVEVGFDEETDRTYQQSSLDNNLVRIPLRDFIDYEQIDSRPHDQVALNAGFEDAVFTFLSVTADPLPTIISFDSDQRELLPGRATTATLRWTTRNANSRGVVIEPDIGLVKPDGSLDVSPSRTTTYTLRLKVTGRDDTTASTTITVSSQGREVQIAPRVKCSHGWRHGKGFSCGELELAGFNANEASVAHGLQIDTRRRTTHPQNAKIIRELINA